ncbi:hypothetical protein [Microvirga flavescens]|uniref:hypothetical protein n=1 Tax=Microvirga flavescens TaxID=2249811 RepID=UPI000DD7E6CB|nr:hypothetical protein [Microvirga flavescens]
MTAPLPVSNDAARQQLGFLSLADTLALANRGVMILDPSSTLISPGVDIGALVIFWPGTVVQRLGQSSITIGNGTALFPGTRIVADGGTVAIGALAEIGEEGGFTVKAEAGAAITIGNTARLLGGGSLTLSNDIGNGAQILGPIRCQNCALGNGGDYREPDPDRRGGVLKGSGVARNLHVSQGHVIQSFDLFANAPLRRQTEFHPKPGA